MPSNDVASLSGTCFFNAHHLLLSHCGERTLKQKKPKINTFLWIASGYDFKIMRTCFSLAPFKPTVKQV